MPYAHERINPARHARQACAWLRAATRLLTQGFDALFASGTDLTSRNGGNRHPALSKKTPGQGTVTAAQRTPALPIVQRVVDWPHKERTPGETSVVVK